MSTLAALGRMRLGHVARGSFTSLSVRLIGIALSFAQGVLTARLLGLAGYGTVAAAISLAQVCATIVQFGLGSLAVRVIPQKLADEDYDGVRRFTHRALLIVGALSVTSIALPVAALLAAGSAPAEADVALLVGTFAIAPLSFLLLLRGLAQGLGRVALAQWPGEVLRPGLLVLVLATAAAFGATLGPVAFLGVVVVVAMVAALTAGRAVLGVIRALPASRGGAQEDGRALLADALPFLGISVLAILQAELATLMLRALAAPEQVGLYQPVARLAPLIALPMNAAAMSYTPRLGELWRRGERQRSLDLTHAFTLTTFLAGLLIFATIFLFAPAILWIFGPEFIVAAPMLRIYAAGVLFVAACGPAGAVVTMIGRSRDAFVALAAGTLLQATLSLVLIPAQGAYGATVSVAVGTGVTWIFMLLAARRAGGFDPSLITAIVRLQAARRYLTESRHD